MVSNRRKRSVFVRTRGPVVLVKVTIIDTAEVRTDTVLTLLNKKTDKEDVATSTLKGFGNTDVTPQN